MASPKIGHGSFDCGPRGLSVCRGSHPGCPRSTDLGQSRCGCGACALRRNGSCGTRGGVRPKRGMRRGGGSGDMEGPRHADNAYAGERIDVRHDLSTLLSQKESHSCVILRLSVSGRTHNRFSDQRFWHDLYDDWRPLTIASTSGPYCSSFARDAGDSTSAASSVGVSAIAINVLSVNTTGKRLPLEVAGAT